MNKKFIKFSLRKLFLYHCCLYVKNRGWRNRFLHGKYANDRKAIAKAKFAMLFYGLECKDFYRLKCETKPWRSLCDYVSYYECVLFYSAYNSSKISKLLCDKYLTYELFKDYYHRVVMLISKEDLSTNRAMEKLKDGVSCGLGGGVFKPLNKNKGQGVRVFKTAEEAFEIIKSTDGGIVEQLIEQGEELASFNSSSVNTLRIHTVNYGDEVEVIWPCLRMGRAGSVIDNAGAGGIFAAIDVETGQTMAACDESRIFYEKHPDSGKELVGFIMPAWKDACELAKNLARMVPEMKTVGWDLAYTNNGWVMVEGNAFPLIIYQIATDKGIRSDFERVVKKLKTKA